MATVAAHYGIARESCYSYEQLSVLKSAKAIEAVYVVLPPDGHFKFPHLTRS